MRILVLALLVMTSVLLGHASAQAPIGFIRIDEDTIFIEGHVFNKRTGVPIAGAVIVLPDPCFLCLKIPEPVRLTTDANGFFSAAYRPVPPSPGVEIPIAVSCVLPSGVYSGGSQAILRRGTIRRDIFLRVPGRISRCQNS